MTVFVDANVFLRFLTRDDEGQHEQAAGLFERARDGRVKLLTGPPVLFEVAWTLRSAYRQNVATILDLLESILTFPGLRLTDAALCANALRRARGSGVEFADAYIAALAEVSGADAIATFNLSDFHKLGAPSTLP